MKRAIFLILSAALTLVSCESGPTPFPEVGEAYAVTSGPHEHLFASYYGVNSWSSDNRYVAVLETDLVDSLPKADQPTSICLVDLKNDNELIYVTKTHCWNFQEAPTSTGLTVRLSWLQPSLWRKGSRACDGHCR